MQSPAIADPQEYLNGWFTEQQDVKSSPSMLYTPLDTPLSLDIPSSVTSSRRSSISDGPSSSPTQSPSQSPALGTSPYYHAPRRTSSSRSRAKDPDKIPRPRNAFIIFRCDYCHKHQEATRGTDKLPVPEKTLSKRAGALWKTLDESTKQTYIAQAKEERAEHQRKYPDYKYRPNRMQKGCTRKRKSASLTRREQVEMHMRVSASVKRRTYRLRHDSGSASGSESESPTSIFSTSPGPEPRSGARTPSVEEHSLAHRRSMSLPHLHSDPYPFAHTYFLQPTSCISSPGAGPQRNTRTTRRAASASQRSLPDIPPPDLGYEIDYGPGTAPFVYHPGQQSSTLSLPELLSVPECMVMQDGQSDAFGSPSVSPIEQTGTQDGYFQSQTPLYHRRQRSNTAPSTMSPLTLVSSSLQNWNGQASAAAAVNIPQPQNELPSFSFSQDISSVLTPTSSTMSTPMDTPEYPPMAPFLSDAVTSLIPPMSELDMDRTPRRADFQINVQGQYVPQYTPAPAPMATSFPTLARSDSSLSLPSYEMESYMAGLDALSITPAPYDMSPFQNVDFEDFIYINQD